MTISLFSFVDLYRRQLDIAAHLLGKGADHAAAHHIPEGDMLGWRLAEDMHPLSFQLMVVINFSQLWTARAVDLPVPEAVTADLDVAGYRSAIAAAKAWLDTLTPKQFAGRDETPFSFEIMPGMAPTMPAERWVTGFGMTNIAFHASMAYAILRTNGVALGKIDIFPGGL